MLATKPARAGAATLIKLTAPAINAKHKRNTVRNLKRKPIAAPRQMANANAIGVKTAGMVMVIGLMTNNDNAALKGRSASNARRVNIAAMNARTARIVGMKGEMSGSTGAMIVMIAHTAGMTDGMLVNIDVTTVLTDVPTDAMRNFVTIDIGAVRQGVKIIFGLFGTIDAILAEIQVGMATIMATRQTTAPHWV